MHSLLTWHDLIVSQKNFSLNAGSFSVDPGKIVALIGPNGAGKSTLMRCLAGLYHEESGEIFYQQTPSKRYSLIDRAKFMSWCPSDHFIPFAYTCFDLVQMGRFPWHQGFPHQYDRDLVQRALAKVDLADFAHRTVNELSSGELQRVMIARCLASDTPLLLLDEPTANLDLAHAVGIFEVLADLRKTGVTTIVSVHDINLASQFADEVLILAQGSIAASGPPDVTITVPALQAYFEVATQQINLEGGRRAFVVKNKD